jgi:hypothetical protein
VLISWHEKQGKAGILNGDFKACGERALPVRLVARVLWGGVLWNPRGLLLEYLLQGGDS